MPNRPNILLITTDQQRCDSLGFYGASWARTPAIDALADGGVRLDRAYCTNPVCTPSRVSLFTGLSMHRHGVWHVGCNAPEELPFFPEALRADGYRTASVGKLHLQAHHGSQSRESAGGLGAEPVFPGPYYGMYDVELSKHTYEQGTADAPFAGEYGVGGQGGHLGYAGLSEEAVMTARVYYQAMVRQIDRHVGSIFTRLRELDLERDTLVIFTSDHGELLGDHGLWLKGPYHFEPLIRVPLILRWPGGLPEGEASAGITSLADIAPTVLSAAGLAASKATDGHDLRLALNGEASWPREYALVEYCDDPDHLRPRTIVTQDDKRTVYTDRSFGEYFDLRSDPDELHNRWDDPACAERREELQKRLDRHPPAPLNPVPRVALA